MKPCLLLFFTLFIAAFTAKGQNLVPNPGFEQYTTCPTNFSQINKCKNWQSYTVGGSPDYFNSCATPASQVKVPLNHLGNQSAASGNAYAGIICYVGSSPNFREYLTCTIASLKPGAAYEVSMSVSLADSVGYGTNDLGAYFCAGGIIPVVTSQVLPVTPQISYSGYGTITDKSGWTRLIDTFKADSNYGHIVIGAFKNDASQVRIQTPPTSITYGSDSYYYIDSVVVKLLSKMFFVFNDSLMCGGDSIVVPYSVGAPGYFDSSNVFTLQLSDSGGSFTSPVNIASLKSDTDGILRGIVPFNQIQGAHYRLRIVSSSPADTSLDNGFDIRIKPAVIITAPGDTTVCAGSTVSLSVSSADTTITFTWKGPANFSSAMKSISIPDINQAQAGDYIVIAMAAGCTTGDTVKIAVNPIPLQPTISVNSPLCEGDTIRFSFRSDTGSVHYSWNWQNLHPLKRTDTSVTGIADLLTNGKYVVVAERNKCTSADSANIVVRPKPVITAANNGPLTVGQELKLYATINNTGVNYHWTGPHNFYSTLLNPGIKDVSDENAGTYQFVASNDICSAIAITVVVINDTSDYIFVLFPNPNNGTFTIKGNVNRDLQIPMKIFNDIGQLIYRETLIVSKKFINKTITLPEVANGVYIFRARVDGNDKNIPFVIKR